MDRIRVATLSHAHGHINTYCQVMRDFEDVELVACWDDVSERGEKASKDFGIPFLSDAEEILANPEVDAVTIGCETNRHADLVERAAKAGKHILLQKPMATTLEDCDRITRAVDESSVKFSVCLLYTSPSPRD